MVPKPTVTHHAVEIAGQEIAYTATAGKMVMKTDEGEEKAHLFFVAYTKDAVPDRAHRPVSFCFNGGPDRLRSGSIWACWGHDECGSVTRPSRCRLRTGCLDNHQSLLDITDLVFIDPVSTGYSRPAKGEDRHQFHGYEEDLRSVGQFIHDYTSQYCRWAIAQISHWRKLWRPPRGGT